MSINGVQKCIMLKMFKKLQKNSLSSLERIASILGLQKKWESAQLRKIKALEN
jgi:hypothetical protein